MTIPHDPTAHEVVTRPTVRQLLELALPVVVSRASQVVVGVTDAAMVSQLGESALAATTAGAMNVWNILCLFMGIVIVVQSFAAQLTGRGDPRGARRYGWYGLVVSAAAGIASIAVIPFMGRALELLDYSAEVKSLMTTYLGFRLLSGGCAIGLEALGAYYGGIGNTRLPMVAQVVAMGANVALNWVLITGNLGAPALGVAGAAIASSLATTLAFAGLLLHFVRAGRRLAAPVSSVSSPPQRELLRLLRFGIPSGLNWFIEFLAFSFFINVVVPGLGTTALAAFMSVLQLNSVAFMPAFALASAGAIFVGQAIGAGKRDDVPRTVRLTTLVAGCWMGCVALVYVATPALFMRPFVADTATAEGAAAFIALGTHMLLLSCLWQLFDATAIVVSEALRAAGDTRFTFVARFAIAWAIFVPGAWYTVRHAQGGATGAVLWLVAYLALLSVVLVVRFVRGRWRTIELTEELLVP